jgi:hypothetical protein
LDEDDEDIKNLLNSVQSDPSIQSQRKEIFQINIYLLQAFLILATRAISSKRTRRSSKTSSINDKNNEYIFDEEHIIELLKRLKQQTSDDESNLLETLISKSKIFD